MSDHLTCPEYEELKRICNDSRNSNIQEFAQSVNSLLFESINVKHLDFKLMENIVKHGENKLRINFPAVSFEINDSHNDKYYKTGVDYGKKQMV